MIGDVKIFFEVLCGLLVELLIAALIRVAPFTENGGRLTDALLAYYDETRPPEHRCDINICWSEEDGCFLARVPQLGVCVHGATHDAALSEALTVIGLCGQEA